MRTITEVTIDDLYRVPENSKAELVDGEHVFMSPTGFWPGRASGRIYRSLDDYEQRTGVSAPTILPPEHWWCGMLICSATMWCASIMPARRNDRSSIDGGIQPKPSPPCQDGRWLWTSSLVELHLN